MTMTDTMIDTSDVVPDTSVWAGWQRAKAAAWATAMLTYERPRFTTTAKHMLLHALWFDWHERGRLPELREWEQAARRFEARGVTADAYVRFREEDGVAPWSPAVDRVCRKARTSANDQDQQGAAAA